MRVIIRIHFILMPAISTVYAGALKCGFLSAEETASETLMYSRFPEKAKQDWKWRRRRSNGWKA